MKSYVIVRVVCAALLLAALPPGLAAADDAGRDLKGTLQKARSRMMGMQVDNAVTLFREAGTQLATLRQAQPQHADLAALQKKYDKLAVDLGKKVVQRAGRDVNPMRSALEAALRDGDAARADQARTKLAAALDKHRANLEAVGGTAGATLLAKTRALLGKEGPATEPTPADTPDKPAPAPAAPGRDATSIHDEIQRQLRGARSHSTAELVKTAKVIRKLIADLRTADPQHPRLASFEAKIEKLVADAYAGDVRRARAEIDRRISRIDSYLQRNQENERPQLLKQRDLLAKALKDHRAALEAAGPDGLALIVRSEEALKKANAGIGAALEGDAVVNEWIAKLGTYNRGGAKDISPGINGAAQYAKIKEWRAEAEALWATYEKTAFPQGKTPELERAAHFLRESMDESDRNLAYAVRSRLEGSQAKLKYVADMFAADQAWRKDAAVTPKRFADELLDAAARAIAEFASYAPQHPSLASLRVEHKRLLAENTERRGASRSLTFLRPDIYQGKDASALKAFARARVPKDHPGAQALRVTLFTPEWKTKSVIEWTDTTRTALRHRTTRTLMFCVAFKDSAGVFRDFGYLNQDRAGDAWGPIYGHLAKYRAPMLVDNVGKDEPATK